MKVCVIFDIRKLVFNVIFPIGVLFCHCQMKGIYMCMCLDYMNWVTCSCSKQDLPIADVGAPVSH